MAFLRNDSLNLIHIYSFSADQEISFLSFLTDFSDSFSSNWNNQEIYGRMDPIYTYKNTTRKITVAFDVPSGDITRAKLNSSNADKLTTFLYPVYQENSVGAGTATIGSPPLVRIKLANLIYRADQDYRNDSNPAKTAGLLGFIEDFTFKPELDSGFFIDPDLKTILPKLYKVNFNFSVIHEHALGFKVDPTGNHTPRITLGSNLTGDFPRRFPTIPATPTAVTPTPTTVSSDPAALRAATAPPAEQTIVTGRTGIANSTVAFKSGNTSAEAAAKSAADSLLGPF